MDLIKSAIDLLPAGKDTDIIKTALHSAERELVLAEAALAQNLHYDLCRCTFPPQIMLFSSQRNESVCPACQHRLSKAMTSYVGKMPSKWDDC